MKTYPDVTRLFESKKQMRTNSAQLPVEEKIAILKQWQSINPVFDAIRQQVREEYAAKRDEQAEREERLLKRD